MNAKTEKLLEIANASIMLNTIKGIHDKFCSQYTKCNGCPIASTIGTRECVQYEINEITRKMDLIYCVEREKHA